MSSPATSPDRIEKTIVLRAPRARVWRALASHEEFGKWFGVIMDKPFTPGATVNGKILDPEWADKPLELDPSSEPSACCRSAGIPTRTILA